MIGPAPDPNETSGRTGSPVPLPQVTKLPGASRRHRHLRNVASYHPLRDASSPAVPATRFTTVSQFGPTIGKLHQSSWPRRPLQLQFPKRPAQLCSPLVTAGPSFHQLLSSPANTAEREDFSTRDRDLPPRFFPPPHYSSRGILIPHHGARRPLTLHSPGLGLNRSSALATAARGTGTPLPAWPLHEHPPERWQWPGGV